MDPPFNKNKVFTAPIGSTAEGASFKDIFREEDIKEEWLGLIEENYPKIHSLIKGVKEFSTKYNWCYLSYMAIRLIECHRVLKETGSLYLHCDPTMSHYLKLLLECIFEEKNFRNEIVWCYKSGGSGKKYFSKKHDVILFYNKDKNYKFNMIKEKSYMGVGYSTGNKNVVLYKDKNDIFLGPYTLVNTKDWWQIGMMATSSKKRIGYPTQKPLALLERIIKASSNEGDVVLDPFCGCATTCVAAERLNRQWIGIDISEKAYFLVNQRLRKEVQQTIHEFNKKVIYRKDIPDRTDEGKIKHYRHPENKAHLYGKQEGNCNGCRQHFPYGNFEIDHIIPKVKGRSDKLGNLQLLCNLCNKRKGGGTMSELKVKLKKEGLMQ